MEVPLELNERMIRLSDAFTNALSNQTFKIFLEDLIELSKYNNEKYQKGKNESIYIINIQEKILAKYLIGIKMVRL
ncbi:hypothetical protein ACVPOQ_06815 [Staphylococcus aureus]